jgi:hypothetical protein
MYNTTTFGVIFVLHQNGNEIARIPVDSCDKPVAISLPDLPNFTCGIFTEIVPGEAGSNQEWQEIQVAKINGKLASINKDTYVFDEPMLEQILPADLMEVKRSKFAKNKKAKAEAVTRASRSPTSAEPME